MANSVENPISPLLIGSFAPLAFACLLAGPISAHAADVVVQPAAGSGFVVKDAGGANERLRVQESGVVNLPGIPAAPAQSQGLCMSAGGQLGPCSGGTGVSYAAGTGLTLTGTTFSVAPTYRLPQGCSANEIAQWSGTAWGCGSAGGATLPVGDANNTLRYDASKTLVSNDRLLAFSDGSLLASGTFHVFDAYFSPSGAGTRLMWFPARAAFRAGAINGTQWDLGNIGDYSVAMGVDTIASGSVSTALGAGTTASGSISAAMGEGTTASGSDSTAMGEHTTASGIISTAMGQHTTASGDYGATAMGYYSTASGSTSTAIGDNTVASANNSVAMGFRTVADGEASIAMGTFVGSGGHKGSFIFGDASRATGIVNDDDNQFVAIADRGFKLVTSSTGGSGAVLPPGSGTWGVLSDRHAKTAVQPVDVSEVLKKVAALPMNTWQYKTQESKYRHMGPMAQDFYAAFQLGEADTTIDTIDADGVALAAIQGLNVELAERDRKIATLNSQLDTLVKSKDAEIAAIRGELSAQTKRVAALESLAGDVANLKKQLAASHQPATTTVALANP